MNLTDPELVTCGIGGAALVGLLLASFPQEPPKSWLLWAIVAAVIVGVAMLGAAVYDMLAN